MTYDELFALIAAWNGTAVLLGVLGGVRPALRRKVARWTSLQAMVAVAVSAVGLVVQGAIPVLGALLGFSTIPVGAFFGAFFWALGGLVPLTVTIFLRAERREDPPTERAP